MAGEEEAPTPPDRPNLKRDRLEAAVLAAEGAEDEVCPAGARPTTYLSSLVSSGWISAPTADDFVADLDGWGTTLRTSFQDAVTYFEELVATSGPEMVAHDDPRGDPANWSLRPPNF